jgi:hypothetical protein
MSRSILGRAAFVMLAAVATACSGSTSPSAPPTTGAAPSASRAASASPATSASPAPSVAASRGPAASGPAALLYGTYFATIPSGVNAEPGKWKLTVSEFGVSFTRPDDQSFSPGALSAITANEIVLAPDPGCPIQAGTPTEGRYRWSREGDALRLEVVSDSCRDRIDTLTSSEWSMNP